MEFCLQSEREENIKKAKAKNIQDGVKQGKEVFGLRKRLDFKMLPAAKLIFALYYLGLVLGALYASAQNGQEEGYLYYYVSSFLQRHTGGSFLSVFSLSFLALLGMHLFLLLCSFACFGIPFILIFSLLRGISGGMIGAFLYLEYSWKGILFQLLILLLPAVIQSMELLWFASRSLKSSGRLFQHTLLRRAGAGMMNPNDMLQDFILFATIGMAGAILEGVLAMLFGPVFQV